MASIESIKCGCCGLNQSLAHYEFRKDSGTYRKTCRQCRNATKHRTQLSPERLEALRVADKLKQRRRRGEKGEIINSQRRTAYEENKDKIIERNKNWRKENWDVVFAQRKESGYIRRSRKKWYHKRGKHDLQYVISERLRRRLRRALENGRNSTASKVASAMELVGCSIAELINHIENQFKDGMTWDNYGIWHIDHIRPCNSFDLDSLDQQKLCFHYTNLQPLWGRENILKGDKMPEDTEQVSGGNGGQPR
jgi:hypothetical protein